MLRGAMSDDASQEELAPVEVDDLELPEEQADEVRGGKAPPSPPGGPQPIPYPN
jgi:hypothetical protein